MRKTIIGFALGGPALCALLFGVGAVASENPKSLRQVVTFEE